MLRISQRKHIIELKIIKTEQVTHGIGAKPKEKYDQIMQINPLNNQYSQY